MPGIVIPHGSAALDGQNSGIRVKAPGQVFAAVAGIICRVDGQGDLRQHGEEHGQRQTQADDSLVHFSDLLFVKSRVV